MLEIILEDRAVFKFFFSLKTKYKLFLINKKIH